MNQICHAGEYFMVSRECCRVFLVSNSDLYNSEQSRVINKAALVQLSNFEILGFSLVPECRDEWIFSHL
jgi:hypothetical protein